MYTHIYIITMSIIKTTGIVYIHGVEVAKYYIILYIMGVFTNIIQI